MNARLVVGMVALSLMVAGFAPAPVPKDPAKTPAGIARKQMQGSWQVKFLETTVPATNRPSGLRVGSRVRIVNDRWVTSSKGKRGFAEREGPGRGGPGGRSKGKGKSASTETILVPDPRRDPPRFDLRRPADRSVQMRGIYRLEGDLLTICYFQGADAKGRPEAFDPVPEGATLIILERGSERTSERTSPKE